MTDEASSAAVLVEGRPGAMIVIISGPSGVGKDTILRSLKSISAQPERHFVVTYKTRAPRDSEVDGVDYQFVSNAEFERLMRAGRLLESAEVHGYWSGTPRDQVEQALAAGRDAILKIDVQGADMVKRMVPAALRIFVAPPSAEDLTARLTGRGTETPADLARRRSDADGEMQRRSEYDYVVVNETDQAEQTALEIDGIIRHEHALYPERRIEL
ncbi:guanylate kinase [soil metagenome]